MSFLTEKLHNKDLIGFNTSLHHKNWKLAFYATSC